MSPIIHYFNEKSNNATRPIITYYYNVSGFTGLFNTGRSWDKVQKTMKKKKSSGIDKISQECLLLGAEILTIPLTRLINSSIDSGIFPEEWEKGVVTPLLKKGDPNNTIELN